MAEEIGVAASIEVKQFSAGCVDGKINEWLLKNPDIEIIEIKFATSATNDEWLSDVLIIYRKEN